MGTSSVENGQGKPAEGVCQWCGLPSGVDDVSKVKAAYIESDGRISVIEFNGKQRGKKDERAGG